MKKSLVLLLISSFLVSWTRLDVKEASSGSKLELQENRIYTVPEGKKWKIDVKTLHKFAFCQDAGCIEKMGFSQSVEKKAEAHGAKIEGSITLSSGFTIKTQQSDSPIIIYELTVREE